MRYAILALLLCAGPVYGAPPKVPGVAIAKAGQEAVIEIESPAAGVSVAWRETFAPADCFVGEMKPLRADTLRLIFLPRKAGLYTVVVWSGKEREDSAVVVVDATGGVPIIPDKKDDVLPPPTPKVVAKGKQYVVIIWDQLKADPATAAALVAPEFRAWLKTNGHELELINTASEAGALKAIKYNPAYKAFGLPEMSNVLVLQNATVQDGQPVGWVNSVTKLPSSADSLMTILKTLTGK